MSMFINQIFSQVVGLISKLDEDVTVEQVQYSYPRGGVVTVEMKKGIDKNKIRLVEIRNESDSKHDSVSLQIGAKKDTLTKGSPDKTLKRISAVLHSGLSIS